MSDYILPTSSQQDHRDDVLDFDQLLALGLDDALAGRVLDRWGVRGHDRRLCVEAEGLEERLELLAWEHRQEGRP